MSPDQMTVVAKVEKVETALLPVCPLYTLMSHLKEVRDVFEPEASADAYFSAYALKISENWPLPLEEAAWDLLDSAACLIHLFRWDKGVLIVTSDTFLPC